jgi:hypothetical protein
VPVEKAQAGFDLEQDALPLERHHRRELRCPGGDALERIAFRGRIAIDHAQRRRKRLGRSHRLPRANACFLRSGVRARDERALRRPFGDYERLETSTGAFCDLEGECGKFECDPEHEMK